MGAVELGTGARNEESNLSAKNQIGNVHSLTLKLQKCRIRDNNALRVLIVEPEKDIQKNLEEIALSNM